MKTGITTSEARQGLPALTCSRIWHGKPCGCKTFRYWRDDKGRMSYAHPRKCWEPWMKEAHCAKCGEPISSENRVVALSVAPFWIMASNIDSDEIIKTLSGVGAVSLVAGIKAPVDMKH